MATSQTTPPKAKLSADKVAWIGDVLERHGMAIRMAYAQPGISRMAQTVDLAALLELMVILNLEFEDEAAAGNAISRLPELRNYSK